MTEPYTVYYVSADSPDPRHTNLARNPGWYGERDDWVIDMGLAYGPYETKEQAEAKMQGLD